MKFQIVNRFRLARGRVLSDQISALSKQLGRKVNVLDVGGSAEYWKNVNLDDVDHIKILNIDADEFKKSPDSRFSYEVGDGRHLSAFETKSVDLVHSNSVIEHVGPWPEMCAMADEVLRVGKSGWIQTPAWEFPIEPHFRLPFLHWFAQPHRRAMLRFSKPYRALSAREKRLHIDRINLVSYPEMKALFPNCDIFVEWVVLPKSYTARWLPSEI